MHISEKTSLITVTEDYLLAGRFDGASNAVFSSRFHRFYHSASLNERLDVSELICRKRCIPLDVLTLLCCDNKKVATPILANSPLLDEGELTTQILQGTQFERQAIAQRLDLTPVLVSHLLSFREETVARRLQDNLADLSGLSEKLQERINRLAGVDLDKTGQRLMTQKKHDNLDDLVSSMEQDWYAHYQPDSLEETAIAASFDDAAPNEPVSDSSEMQETGSSTTLELSASGEQADPPSPIQDPLHQQLEQLFDEETEDARMESNTTIEDNNQAEAAELKSDGFLSENELDLLAQLGGDDWEMLDDDAIEALAGSLARESIALMEEDAAQDGATLDGRSGFKIGAFDQTNAPIPPIEVLDPDMRAATISFRTPGSFEDANMQDMSAKETSQSVPPPAAIAPEPKAKTSAASASTPQTSDVKSPSENTIASKQQTAGDQEKRKPQITLTIRKRASVTEEQETKSEVQSAAEKVELTSATEDDWLSALAKLNRDFDPESASRATAGFVETAPKSSDDTAEPIATAEVAQPVSSDRPAKETEPAETTDRPLLEAKATAKPKRKRIRLASRPLNPLSEIEAPVSTEQDAEVRQSPDTKSKGFVPDMVSFDDLELIEAVPDLPSATELLLDQHKRATPFVDLVEPVDITVLENGTSYSLSEMEVVPMQVIIEQLAAEKATVSDASTSKTTLDVAESPAEIQNRVAEDMTELPEMAAHRLVDVEEYENLKASETPAVEADVTSSEQPASASTSPSRPKVQLREIEGVSRPENGIADQFYAYDAESRLTVLQAILSETLSEASDASSDHRQRTLLSEDVAQDLVMARFSNNRIKLSEMLHDISGHRRMDITRLLQDTGGEALVVYLYHIGLDEGSTLSMVLHGPDAVSHDYGKVEQLMTLYNQLYPAAADRVIEDLFGSLPKTQFTHQPIHENGKGDASARLREFRSTTQSRTQTETRPVFGRRVSNEDRT